MNGGVYRSTDGATTWNSLGSFPPNRNVTALHVDPFESGRVYASTREQGILAYVPVCGDGVTDGGESCDDGNVVSGDGCSAVCQAEVLTGCPMNPRNGCRVPMVSGKASLKIKDATPDDKDHLQWKWGSGAATSLMDFGDPTSAEDYFLCLYDNRALISSTAIPAGGFCLGKACWKASATGFQYSNKSRLPDGAQQLKLKAGGDGKAQILLKASGLDLETPALGTSLTGPIVVQLRQSSDTVCWQATYGLPFAKNDGVSFTAKAD